MTFTEEFVPVQGGGEFDSARYPTAFGITFTPPVIGILLGALLLAGGVYLAATQVWPAFNENRTKRQEVESKEQELVEKQNSLENVDQVIAEKAAATGEFDQVMALYASEDSLNTLLYDISNSLTDPADPKRLLSQFAPEGEVQVIEDGSLGEAANGMLKRQAYTISTTGSYSQTEEFIQTLERQTPLLRVTDFQTTSESLVQEVSVSSTGTVDIQQKEPILQTELTLEALIQRSREEIEAERDAAAEAAAAAAPAEGAPAAEETP